MSEFLATFSGVILAFMANRAYEWLKKGSNRQKLLISLKKELKQNVDLLTGQGNLLSTEIWESAKSSGDLMLLGYDKREKICWI